VLFAIATHINHSLAAQAVRFCCPGRDAW